MSHAMIRLDPETFQMDQYVDQTSKPSHVFKTEVDLQVRGPHRETTLRLVGLDTNPKSGHGRNQVTPIISAVGNNVEIKIWNCFPSKADHELDTEVKVEESSSKNVSALISQFNKVNTSYRPIRGDDSKIPVKKLRTDFYNVLQDRANRLADMDTQPDVNPRTQYTQTDVHGPGLNPRAESQNLFSPDVHFKVKFQADDDVQTYKREPVTDGAAGDSHYSRRKVTVAKPLVKLRSFKNGVTQDRLTQDGSTLAAINQLPTPTKEALGPKINGYIETVGSGGNMFESSEHGYRDNVLAETSAAKSHHVLHTSTPNIATDLTKHEVPRIDNSAIDDVEKEGQFCISPTENHHSSSDVKGQSGDSTEYISTKITAKRTGRANSEEEMTNQETRGDEKELITDKLAATSPLTSDVAPVSRNQVSQGADSKIMSLDPNYPETDSWGVRAEEHTDSTEVSVVSSQDMESLKSITEQAPNCGHTNSHAPNCGHTNSHAPNCGHTNSHAPNCECENSEEQNREEQNSEEQNREEQNSEEQNSEEQNSEGRNSDSLGTEYSNISGRINDKLQLLKSELMAMREMDLALLKQLININQTIQRIQKSDVPKVSRSLSFLNRNRSLQYRYRPLQRQNSAPHCPNRRRFLFSNLRSNTEEDLRDSLSSFDESEVDSQSELEESTSSLNSIISSSSRAGSSRRMVFQSREVILSLDASEDGDQNYEDILRRNVRLWKLSSQIHRSFQEEVAVWY